MANEPQAAKRPWPRPVESYPVDVKALVEKCLAPWAELIARAEADRD